MFILYSIGIGAGAINTGNNLLYLIFGIFLGLILASGVLSDLTLWGLTASWEFPLHGEAGEASFIRLSLQNTKRKFSSLGVTVEMTGSLRGEPVILKAYVPWVPPNQTVPTHIRFTPPQRGRFLLESVKFTTQFPFGLLVKWWRLSNGTGEAGFLIYPRPLAASLNDWLRSVAEGSDMNIRAEKGEGVSLFGLREFQPSDTPRRIHWKASAKRAPHSWAGGSWLVKEMEKDQKPGLLAVWNLDRVAGIGQAEAETMIEFGAALARFFEAQGRRVRMAVERPSCREIKNITNVWDFLALWNPALPAERSVGELLSDDGGKEGDVSADAIDIFALYRAWQGQRKAV